jgi:hypothetical protein
LKNQDNGCFDNTAIFEGFVFHDAATVSADEPLRTVSQFAKAKVFCDLLEKLFELTHMNITSMRHLPTKAHFDVVLMP